MLMTKMYKHICLYINVVRICLYTSYINILLNQLVILFLTLINYYTMNSKYPINNNIDEFNNNLIEFFNKYNDTIFESYRINLSNNINHVDIKLINKVIYNNKLYVYISINFTFFIDNIYRYQQYIGLNNYYDTYVSFDILHQIIHYFDIFNSNIPSVNIIDNNNILKSNIMNSWTKQD